MQSKLMPEVKFSLCGIELNLGQYQVIRDIKNRSYINETLFKLEI